MEQISHYNSDPGDIPLGHSPYDLLSVIPLACSLCILGNFYSSSSEARPRV